MGAAWSAGGDRQDGGLLASSDAVYITGVVLPVDGGWSVAGASAAALAMAQHGGK